MDLYYRKKESLMSGPQKLVSVDAKTEIDKKRASSPAPVSSARSLSVSGDRKVVYKGDLEDYRKKINDDVVAQFVLKSEETNKQIEELNRKMQELNASLENMGKMLESTKSENLKNQLNQHVLAYNESIHKLTDELTIHLDDINSLKSRVGTIESVLD